MTEEWRAVSGYEGRYEVSNLGRVRSIAGKRAGTILYQPQTPMGRYKAMLFDPVTRKTTTWLVHRLVLTAFVGPCPAGLIGCHNDGNHLNNVVENLRWGSPKSNTADMKKHGTAVFGERHPHSRFSEDEVRHLRYLKRAYDFPIRYLAKLMGCSYCAVHSALVGKTWAHIPQLRSS